MARGPKRHLKRLNAPRHWMLDKLGGVWAPRPSTGPHKLRECLPLIILLRNRLKYALNTKEVKYILMQRLIKVDGKARTDKTYPAGFMGACRSPERHTHEGGRAEQYLPSKDAHRFLPLHPALYLRCRRH